MKDKIIFDSEQEELIAIIGNGIFRVGTADVRFIVSLGYGLFEIVYKDRTRTITNQEIYFTTRRLDD